MSGSLLLRCTAMTCYTEPLILGLEESPRGAASSSRCAAARRPAPMVRFVFSGTPDGSESFLTSFRTGGSREAQDFPSHCSVGERPEDPCFVLLSSALQV